MQNILVESSEDEDEDAEASAVHDAGHNPTHQEFVFGYSSTMLSLRGLHPQLKHLPKYWAIWVENASPIIKYIHGPTMEKLFNDAVSDLNQISRPIEALMFGLYLAVVSSLSNEQCKQELDLDRDHALKRYRYATEQALARAGFIETQDFLVMQAFTLYLVCIRRQDDIRLGWTMVGLAIRIANSLGLHRDGSNFGLNPYDTEMRRRCWYQILALGEYGFISSESEALIPIRCSIQRGARRRHDGNSPIFRHKAPAQYQRQGYLAWNGPRTRGA